MGRRVRHGVHTPVQICCECERPRERCRGIVLNLDQSITVVCPACWRALEYEPLYMKRREPIGHRDSRVA